MMAWHVGTWMTISDKETTKKAASSLKGWLVAICVQKKAQLYQSDAA